jgi:hypothetical protein
VDYAVFDAAPGAYVASYPFTPGPPATAAGAGAARDRTAPRVQLKLKRKTLRASKRGIVTLRVRCPRSERHCIVDARIRSKGKRLAKTRSKVVIGGGKTAKLRLKLTKAARARLARRGAIRATVVVRTRDAAGNRRTTRTAIRLLRPRS